LLFGLERHKVFLRPQSGGVRKKSAAQNCKALQKVQFSMQDEKKDTARLTPAVSF